MRSMANIWAHRGWRSRYPDNTAIALGSAFGLVDTVEIDVRRTADRRLVLSHDPELGGRVVAETSWSTLRGVDLGDGQRPLLLEEALSSFPDRRFDIEIKNSVFEPGFDPDGGILAQVVEMARPGDLLTSFDWPSLARHRAAAAVRDLQTGLLVDLDMPMADVIAHADRSGHDVVLPSMRLLESWSIERAVDAVHRAGLELVVWTVNDPAAAGRLLALGVDAVITDDPLSVVAVLS